VKLEELAKSANNHGALNNEFYQNWLDKKFNISALKIFARNYGEWVKSFPDTLALLFSTTQDPDAKIEYIQTLYSEMGYGNSEKVHWKLLDMFYSELSSKLGDKTTLDRNKLENELELLPSTKKLIEQERELYGNKNSALSVGAQLALEWQAYTMLRKLFEGSLNYQDLWEDRDEFHEACEYFYVHIGAAEKEHKKESLEAAKKYATDEKSLDDIKQGFNQHLELIENFWNGVYNEIKKVKQ